MNLRQFFSTALACLPMVFILNIAQAQETITISGSTTVAPIASRAAEAFLVNRPEIRILVNGGGSGVGINAVGSGLAQIGMASRMITPRELSRFERSQLKAHAVGRDGVACAISASIYNAGVRALTREQIAGIYLGKIKNWSALGGPDSAIVVIDKERHRGTRHVFMNYVFGDANARTPGARLVTGSNNEERAKIAQSDAAIGMLSLAWLNDAVKGVAIQEGDARIEPSVANVRSGAYPITRDLLFVTAGEPVGAVKEFMEFIYGPKGKEIVVDSGYIPIERP